MQCRADIKIWSATAQQSNLVDMLRNAPEEVMPVIVVHGNVKAESELDGRYGGTVGRMLGVHTPVHVVGCTVGGASRSLNQRMCVVLRRSQVQPHWLCDQRECAWHCSPAG